ncbi:MAG: D-cysteine desulfhydrase family protein [Hyphomicrobiales bacterium]|nr:D-cysteine desulfhydrase family protein [Hyphomicrobiales bacterium]
MNLTRFPRVDLAHLPTPIEPMANLSAHVGGGRLYVKRDDCTGLAFGGNKVRQLEFYLGAAMAQGADTVLITGAVQSNFVRLTAAAARKLGMDCHIQLEERVAKADAAYRNSGNVLLDRLLGATLHSYPDGEDEAGADRQLRDIADGLRAAGRTPYVIPLAPGHPPLGALGYVDAAGEIVAQCADIGLDLDEIVVASGSGHTHAGLLFGLRALNADIRVTGVCVRRSAALQRPRIASRCDEIAALLDRESPVRDSDIHLTDAMLAPGYGRLNQASLDATSLAARTEALMLDPVYTAKTMAAFLQRARQAEPEQALMVLHTGGTPAVFAYERELSSKLSKAA